MTAEHCKPAYWDIRETKVREFLHDIGSGLLEEQDTRTLYRHLRIAEPVNGHDAPRNIGLLFFSQNPEQWFAGARIEVVQFAADTAGNVIEEKVFAQRPIHEQLRECLAFLENLSVRQIQKIGNRSQAAHWVSYPSLALREGFGQCGVSPFIRWHIRAYQGLSLPGSHGDHQLSGACAWYRIASF